MKKILTYIGGVFLVEIIGITGTIFTSPSITTWYTTINKPSFNPPNWIFGPVWTLLFALIGISLAIVWMKKDSLYRKPALIMFAIQLGLNVMWSYLFFDLHNPQLAFIEIVALWIAILFNIYYAYKVNKTAGLLLIPYILWVSFASILNFVIWQLN